MWYIGTFPPNLVIHLSEETMSTDDGRLRHDSSSAVQWLKRQGSLVITPPQVLCPVAVLHCVRGHDWDICTLIHVGRLINSEFIRNVHTSSTEQTPPSNLHFTHLQHQGEIIHEHLIDFKPEKLKKYEYEYFLSTFGNLSLHTLHMIEFFYQDGSTFYHITSISRYF